MRGALRGSRFEVGWRALNAPSPGALSDTGSPSATAWTSPSARTSSRAGSQPMVACMSAPDPMSDQPPSHTMIEPVM
jgi:hypothetical protein